MRQPCVYEDLSFAISPLFDAPYLRNALRYQRNLYIAGLQLKGSVQEQHNVAFPSFEKTRYKFSKRSGHIINCVGHLQTKNYTIRSVIVHILSSAILSHKKTNYCFYC